VSRETLMNMSHLSLRKRIPIVREKLGLPNLQHSTLRTYYNRYGIKSMRPDYSYYKTMAEQRSLQHEQLEFASDLGTLIMKNAYDEIIYIDETSFHLWQKMGRCWVRPGMKLPMVISRGPSISVIGAISEARGLVHHHMICESNNTENF